MGTPPPIIAPPRRRPRPKAPCEARWRPSIGTIKANAWSGRGLKPKWLTAALAAGKKIEEFAI
jgi:DNA-binding protein H-NS